MIVELLVTLLINWAISKWLAPKPKETAGKKSTFAQFQFPRADEAVPMPIFWGSVRITGPIVIHAKLFKATAVTQEISGDTTTVAYRYELALQFLLGAPGKRFGGLPPSTLTGFSIGERTVWAGQISTDRDMRQLSKRTLFGGDGAGGGVKGLISYLTGTFDQTNHKFIRQMLTRSALNTKLAYRGQAVVTLFGIQGMSWGNDGLAYVGDTAINNLSSTNTPCGWVVGENAQLDGYSFSVTAPTTTSIDGHIVGPIGQDANPVCVLWDMITNPWDRLGRDASTIDEPSFYAAAATLNTEGNGFSLVLSQAVESREAIRLVLEQIDGVLYDDISTGTLKLALIREDYVVDDLDLIDPDTGIEVIDFQQGTWDGTFNQVRVTFSDRTKKGQDAPAVAQDQSNFYATNEKVRSRDVHYPGCTLKATADKLASRDLKALSLPLAKMKIAVDRNAYTKRPGDVFKFSWPTYNGMSEVVFRVLKYDLGKPGTPDAERVVLDCAQDRFAFKHTVFHIPHGNTVPIDPAPSLPTDYHHTEAPLWLASRAELAGRIVDAFAGGRRLYLAVPRAHSVAMHAEVALADTDDYAKDIEPQPYPGRGFVAETYARENEPYDTGTGLVVCEVAGWTPAAAVASDIKLYGKNLLLIGTEVAGEHEFVTFETATDNGDGTWTLGNVGRGALDTSPLTHLASTVTVGSYDFDVADEDNGTTNVVVPAGTYTVAALIALVHPQLPAPAWVFGIDATGHFYFSFLPTIIQVDWTGAETLRDQLGFTENAEDWDCTPPALDGEDSSARGPFTARYIARTAGTRVWSLHVASGAQVTRVGRVAFDYAATAVSRISARGLAQVRVSSIVPAIDVTAVSTVLRIARPYPVADLEAACASLAIGDTPGKSPAQLVEGGLDFTWKRRNRLSGTILRGDVADEAPEPDTTYKLVARTRGEDGEIDNVASAVAASQPYTTTGYDDVLLGAAGYGAIEAGVRSQAPLRSGNPAAPMLGAGWMDAVLSVDAPHWRNLLANGRFDQDLDGWTTAAGAPTTGHDATESLGASTASYYLMASDEDNVELTQTIDVSGYIPNRLAAVLHFYHHMLGADVNDTVTVKLESLDSGSGVLDTATSGAITPSNTLWTEVVISVANLDPDTKYLRVTVDLVGVGGGPQGVVTEMVLRACQATSQLLSHPNFDTFNNLTHVIAGWTNVDDYFLGSTGTPPYYVSNTFVTPGNVATSEIKQEVAIPTGFRGQGSAVMEFARTNINADGDTGEVVLEALNGGGFVTESVTTGAHTAPVGSWDRHRLVLAMPPDGETLRVRLLGVRATGSGNCDTGFGNLDLRVYKDLSPTGVDTISLDVPAAQAVPPDYDYFDRAWPEITPPTLAFWQGGDTVGQRGTEPQLSSADDGTATAPATVGAKFVGAYDTTRAGTVLAQAYDFPPECDAGFVVDDSDFAAFTSADAFAVVVELKVSEAPRNFVICGRVGTYGWELVVNVPSLTQGYVVARLIGTDGTVEATGGRRITDLGLRVVGMVYDPVAAELHLVDSDGVTTTSTAGLGEMSDETATTYFAVGQPTGNGGFVMQGQIANVFMWAVDDVPTTADVQTMITHGGAPDPLLSQDRTAGSLALVVGTDDDGVLVCRFSSDQFAYGYHAELAGDGETGLGWPYQLLAKNRIIDYNGAQAIGDWHTVGSPTVELNYGFGVEGDKNSFSVTGSNAEGRELRNITAGTTVNKMVAFFARAATAHTARLALNNASDVNKGNFDFAATATWQLFWHLFTTWDNSTPTCRLRWCGSDTGSDQQVEVCGPFYLSETDAQLVAIPLGLSASADLGYNGASFDLPTAANDETNTAEGEIMVTGVAAVETPFDDAAILQWSAGGGADFRVVYNSGGSPSFWLFDGGDSFSSTPSPEPWDVLWTIRGRWNLAGLLDAASAYGGVLFGNALSDPSDYGRTTQFTLDGNQLDEIQFGSTEIGDPMPILVRQVVVRTRERRLAP